MYVQVVIDNGIVSVTLSKPDGDVLALSYHGIPNLLAPLDSPDDKGYILHSIYFSILYKF